MQSARLGASLLCLATLLGTLVRPKPALAQTVLETPQQANDRIRSLSASARLIPHDYIIGSGDVLAIEVFDVKELTREVRVSQTGSISIPLVPVRLRVAGLTETQAEQKIAEVLEANGLVSHPQVSVSVKDRKSKPVTVVGAVLHPMVVQADRQITLLEVLAEAGGISNDAGDTVIIARVAPDALLDPSEPPIIGPEEPLGSASPDTQELSKSAAVASGSVNSSANQSAGQQTPSHPPAKLPTSGISSQKDVKSGENLITINLNQLIETGDARNNIIVQPGDIVTVPHAGIVYVLGAVGHPGGFVVSNDRMQLSTLKILALAGGLNRTARSDHAVIVRKDSSGQQHEVPVNLKKVQNREAEDIQLQPSDIVYVPDSGAKRALVKAAEIGLAIGTGVALYRLVYR